MFFCNEGISSYQTQETIKPRGSYNKQTTGSNPLLVRVLLLTSNVKQNLSRSTSQGTPRAGSMGTVISGQLPAGNVLIFPQTVVGAGYRKVRVM